MTAAAIRATFSDFRIVKGRKVAQLVFEVPLEGADDALASLGGLPQPAAERWCGIARLTEEAAAKPDARERYAQKPEGEQAVARAGILCEDYDFQHWIAPAGHMHAADQVARGRHARSHLVDRLQIASRSDLARDADALQRFLALEARFKSERRYGHHAAR